MESLITIKRSKYTAKESDGFVDVTILVDTPNCKPITVIVQPKEQTPIDASGKNQSVVFDIHKLFLFSR